MTKFFIIFVFLANIALDIYMYLYYSRLSSDINKSKYELNKIKKEMEEAKRNERHEEIIFIETEEDAKNYKIPDNLPTKQDVEKWLKNFD